MNPTNIISIGNNVKFHRRNKRLTQKELANKIGVTHEWICKIERGKANNITLSLLSSIANNLDVDLSDITKDCTVFG